MIANYHSHTTRCNHAVGTEEQYVQNALRRGLEIFGFSDHTPQFFPGDYYTQMRMRPGQLSGYCDSVRDLQEKYRGKVRILLGLEAEYYPALWGELLPQAQDAGIEYMILGQHWVGNEIHEPYCGNMTADEQLLRRYCHQVMEAMDTGKFTYLAHPDLIHYVGNRKNYRHHMLALCRKAKETDTPLEINLLGMLTHRHYPNEHFWELAAEEGCAVILGMDAHDPNHVTDPRPEEKARELIRRLDLKLLDTAPVKPI